MRRAAPIVGLFMARFLFAQDSGLVVSSKGNWSSESLARLSARDPVKYNERLSAGKDSELLLVCGRRSLSYHCPAAQCQNVHACVEVAKDGNADISISHWRNLSLASLFQREQVPAAITGVRAEGGPSDAVVLQTPQGVHWAPALIRVLEGRYCFRLAHVPAPAGGPSRTFTLDWDRAVEKEGIAPVPSLAPGLYAFEKGAPGANGACRVDANSTPAWVLVVPQVRFDEINKQWDEDSSTLDDLEQSGTATSAITTLRHAVLASLADSVEGR